MKNREKPSLSEICSANLNRDLIGCHSPCCLHAGLFLGTLLGGLKEIGSYPSFFQIRELHQSTRQKMTVVEFELLKAVAGGYLTLLIEVGVLELKELDYLSP